MGCFDSSNSWASFTGQEIGSLEIDEGQVNYIGKFMGMVWFFVRRKIERVSGGLWRRVNWKTSRAIEEVQR